MSEHEKTRDAASEALIALRTAIGKTQASFAVEIMKTAVTTIARYETTHPPRGDTLLRLKRIAEEHQLYDLRDRFWILYLEGIRDEFEGASLLIIPGTQARAASGYLPPTHLEGKHALHAAHALLDILALLKSRDPEPRKAAIEAISALRHAVRKINGDSPGADLKDFFVEWAAGEPASVDFTKRGSHEK